MPNTSKTKDNVMLYLKVHIEKRINPIGILKKYE